MMAANADTEMAGVDVESDEPSDGADLLPTIHSDAFAFSGPEQRALALYDQLRDLELRQSLLQAHTSAHVPNTSVLSDDALQEQLTTAQQEAMEAKAEYEIRNRIIHNVLVMDPLLKAVHRGDRTNPTEKRLLPLINENDTLSLLHGSLTAKLASSTRALSAVEQANKIANQKNRALSQTMLALAEKWKTQSAKDIENLPLREQAEGAEKEAKEARRRKKLLKGVLSAMIVGSGINWAADEKLTELVMDDEGEG